MNCPVPHQSEDHILLAHGEGARLSRRLIRNVILPSLSNEFLKPLSNAALLPQVTSNLVMTTDSYVVSPLFFPGGDIGQLAVYGTVNDLVVCGAEPLYLCVALIIEEGLSQSILRRVLESLASAATHVGVKVVSGDTKVVPRRAADQIFITTTGIGRLRSGVEVGMHRIRAGDRILVSGTIGDHGIAVLAAREQLGFGSELRSDVAPLHEMAAAVFQQQIDVHFMRDPTRGGVSAVLHEISEATGLSAIIDERAVPISEPVRGACELLGLDAMYVANEGKVLLIVPQEKSQHALAILRSHELGKHAAIIGEITTTQPAGVYVQGSLGVLRVLDEPSGAPLPRIC